MEQTKVTVQKAFLVKVLQWFYLLLTLASLSIPFVYNAFFENLGIPNNLVLGVTIILAFYFLLLCVSFFTQISNLLILSLVFIFFTSLGALALLILSLPNIGTIINGNLPKCYTALESCTFREGVIVSAAYFLAISTPTLVINLITIIGAVKGIAAKD